MQVLLVENYPALGYVGDTVQVKSGYARNYLIPSGIAVDVSSRKAKHFQHLLSGVNAKRARLKSEAEELGKQVSSESLSFDLKVGASGKSFGSISSRDALKALQDKGYQLEKKQVRLADTIKTPGDYTVSVQLHADVVVEVPVSVIGIKQKEKPVEGKKKGRKAVAEGAEDGESSEEEISDEALEVAAKEGLEETAPAEDDATESGDDESSEEEEESKE